MGYSPRYRIWTSEWPNQTAETDSQEAIDREKRRCAERGGYYGYVLDTHTRDVEKFGVWTERAGSRRSKEGE